MKARLFRRTLAVAALTLSISPAPQAQNNQSVITKREALENFQTTTGQPLREIISDEGRLRVVFPGKPELDDDVITVKGFRLIAFGARWVVSYSDLPQSVDSNELRGRYHAANMATVRAGQLLSERDVFLNGRLGSELVIRDRDELTHMRAFISGSRLYIIAVIANVRVEANPKIDNDIKSFFDSFTFWDRV